MKRYLVSSNRIKKPVDVVMTQTEVIERLGIAPEHRANWADANLGAIYTMPDGEDVEVIYLSGETNHWVHPSFGE